MFIKPSKKWRNPEGNGEIMVPYTYYRLCESYRDIDGKVKQRTVLGLGELLDFPKESQKKELAYWVVSTTKYRLKQKGINVRWVELLRIMSTQQRVTMVAEQANGRMLRVRRSTTPEAKLVEIQKALAISALPVCSIKFVWPQERPPDNKPPLKSGG